MYSGLRPRFHLPIVSVTSAPIYSMYDDNNVRNAYIGPRAVCSVSAVAWSGVRATYSNANKSRLLSGHCQVGLDSAPVDVVLTTNPTCEIRPGRESLSFNDRLLTGRTPGPVCRPADGPDRTGPDRRWLLCTASELDCVAAATRAVTSALISSRWRRRRRRRRPSYLNYRAV